MQVFRVDLHTHSEASKDGGISPDQYAELLKNERLDVIAITDHGRIDFAQGMQKALGKDKIIVGQEIDTIEGEIVGLYLHETIEPGLSVDNAIKQIKKQGGLVYIPHPFETIRHGIPVSVLDYISDKVDIIESCNGRAFAQDNGPKAVAWARQNNIATAASSDAHGFKGAGTTYSVLQNKPTQDNLVIELKTARFTCKSPPFVSLLYPKINRIKHILSLKG